LYETKDHAVLKVLTITTALQNKPKIGISQPQRKKKKKKAGADGYRKEYTSSLTQS
jgi:hypothetical protein